jgi:hypothetical protein
MAVEQVNFQVILKQNKTVDLKQVFLDASLGWIVRLFRGQDDKNFSFLAANSSSTEKR